MTDRNQATLVYNETLSCYLCLPEHGVDVLKHIANVGSTTIKEFINANNDKTYTLRRVREMMTILVNSGILKTYPLSREPGQIGRNEYCYYMSDKFNYSLKQIVVRSELGKIKQVNERTEVLRGFFTTDANTGSEVGSSTYIIMPRSAFEVMRMIYNSRGLNTNALVMKTGYNRANIVRYLQCLRAEKLIESDTEHRNHYRPHTYFVFEQLSDNLVKLNTNQIVGKYVESLGVLLERRRVACVE